MSDRWIPGLVYPTPPATVLDALDAYEGFGPQNPGWSIFVGVICEAELQPEPTVPLWVDAFRRPAGAACLIVDERYTRAAEG